MTKNNAILSPCGTYRYTLTRMISHYPELLRVKNCLFIMLNPSTADASVDDPTIRRCISFATREKCTSLTVVNLFAFRATDPAALVRASNKLGPDNEWHLRDQIEKHRNGLLIAAWGAHGLAQRRSRAVADILKDLGNSPGLKCLGTTRNGSPRHPLYVRGDAELQPFSIRVGAFV